MFLYRVCIDPGFVSSLGTGCQAGQIVSVQVVNTLVVWVYISINVSDIKMKNIFLTSLTVGSALASDAQKPGSRILSVYDKSRRDAIVAEHPSELCDFKTITALFPEAIVEDAYIPADQDNNLGVNYYGGYRTTIKIPGDTTDDTQFKDYEYFLYNGEQASPGWVNIAKGQEAQIGVHITDHKTTDLSGQLATDLSGDDLDSFLQKAAIDCNTNLLGDCDITTFPKSTYINILQNEPALQGLANPQPPQQLHGSISCLQEISDEQTEGARSGTLSREFNNQAVMTKCSYEGFERTWILGVQSLCSKFAQEKKNADPPVNPASEEQLFAWFKQKEAPRKITINSDPIHGVTNVRSGLQFDTSGGAATNVPKEILFAAPNTVRQSQSSGTAAEGIQRFSAVKSVESSIKFGFTTDRGTGTALTDEDTAPDKCTTVTHSGPPVNGVDTSRANIDLSDGGSATDASFSTACQVHGSATMKVDFRDAPGTESCASALSRIGQVELAIVQFARTHAVVTLPSLKNNTAHQFVLGANIDQDMHTSGFTVSGETTTGASTTGEWSCLDEDQCVKGDPYQVLGVTVTRKTVTGLASTVDTEITASVAPVPLVDPTDVGEYSYVMGIADFSISDCGDMNMDDPKERGEYLPSRRLGADVSTPGNSVTQLHYASYKGY